ncbi:MAG: VOC family protein [Planctomycetota bacterium]|nr:VOC family protein [Planctomycetota bacterium]GIK53935.1 MAG: VOC family protein [Planctomycetota bacterium]
MNRITTFLMFKDRAHEAMQFYCSVFKNSKISRLMKQGGKVVGGTFKINGTTFMCYEGGPHFSFTEGMSLLVPCKTRKEVDYYWSKLSQGGEESMCGWLKDKFGVSWQIIPDALMKCISDRNLARAKRAIDAMLTMRKIDIAAIKRAHAGKN